MIIFILLGIVSSIFQLTVLREFTFSIAKNELSFVVAVGIWFVFGSLGSLLGRKKKIINLCDIPFAFVILFYFTIASIHLSKLLVGLSYYESASLGFVLAAAVVLIGSLSLLIGYAFGSFTNAYLEKRVTSSGEQARFFAFEAIGFFVGGIVFTFFLSDYSNPFVFTFVPVLLLLGLPAGKTKKIVPALLIIILSVFSFLSYKGVLEKEFMGAEILLNEGSHYGPIVLADQGGANSLYVNGSLVATSSDQAWNEEYLHTCLSARKNIKDVLYIGSYFSGQIEEILKYDINKVDCVDINPVLSALSKERIPLSDRKRINFVIDDPRAFIEKAGKKYDCIIMNMPAPSNLAFNRYFSLEFFELVKKRLHERGVFCFYVPSKRDILSPSIQRFDSCIINTVNRVFVKRLLIPSDSMIVIAARGDAVTSERLVENFKKDSPDMVFFTVHHLKDQLDPSRRVYIEGMIDKDIPINTDLYPRGFLYYLLLEQTKFYPDISVDVIKVGRWVLHGFLAIALVLGLVYMMFRKKMIPMNAGVVGFSSIGLTTIIFLIFQTYSGALFWKMGVIVGVFMAGLSLGTFCVSLYAEKRKIGRRFFAAYYLLWAIFLGSLFACVYFSGRMFYRDIVFYVYSFMSGLLTGGVYPLAAKLMYEEDGKGKNVAVTIFSADLAGAFLGTVIVSILFVPFLGIGLSLLMLVFWVTIFGIANIRS
jgi:spermidine synthase